MMEPPFLNESVILRIHADELKRYGGQDGIRDQNSLRSAIAMPLAGFGETFFHEFPFGMAAAYAFHIAENQPFVDGNKRTALAAALTFLEACDIIIHDPDGKLYQAMLDIGNRHLTKEGLSALLKELGNADNK